MKHIVLIWETAKERDIYNIKTRIEISEDDIKALALIKFKEQYNEKTGYVYSADIDKTEI
jgi:hypothetical protein